MAEQLPPAVDEVFAAARGLEAEPVLVRDAVARAHTPRRLRWPSRRVGAALVAGVLVVTGSAFAAVSGKLGVVDEFGGAGTRHSHGDERYAFTYESPNYAVAEVRLPEFGRVRLTYRRSSIGDCHGVQLLDEKPPPGAVRPGAPPWQPGLAEGCGDSSTFQVGLLKDRPWGLVHGRAPETARSVRITSEGQSIARAELVRNAGKVPYVAFVAVVPLDGVCDVRAVADDPTLPQAGGLDVPGFKACRRPNGPEPPAGRPN